MTSKGASVFAVAATATSVAAAALPWARTGGVSRNAYSLVGAARRAGVLSGVHAALASLVFALPLIAGIAITLVGFHASRAAAWAAAGVGVVGLLAAFSVLQSSLEAKPGAIIGMAVGAATTAGGAIAGTRRTH